MERWNLGFHVNGKVQAETPQGEIRMESAGAEEPVVVMKCL